MPLTYCDLLDVMDDEALVNTFCACYATLKLRDIEPLVALAGKLDEIERKTQED